MRRKKILKHISGGNTHTLYENKDGTYTVHCEHWQGVKDDGSLDWISYECNYGLFGEALAKTNFQR